jgi:hypothetical protein
MILDIKIRNDELIFYPIGQIRPTFDSADYGRRTTMEKKESNAISAKMAALIQEASRLISEDFPLQVGGNRTMDEMVQAGHYDGVHSFINQEKFPLEPRQPVEVVVQLIDLDRLTSSEEAVEEFANLDCAGQPAKRSFTSGRSIPTPSGIGPLSGRTRPTRMPTAVPGCLSTLAAPATAASISSSTAVGGPTVFSPESAFRK